MKKVVSALLLSVLLLGAVSATAFAHCGGRGMGNYGQDKAPAYAACPVEDCALWGVNEHDGEYYFCQNYNAGYGCHGGWRR